LPRLVGQIGTRMEMYNILFPQVLIIARCFLSIVQQDHSPHQAKHIMRLEIMWEREESLAGEIKKVWEESTQVQNLGDVATSL
jgi:hypothetical protein